MTKNNAELTVIVRLRATEATIVEGKQILQELIVPTRQNSGNSEFRVFQDMHDELQFTLLEKWQDMAAVKAHGASDYMQNFNDRKDQLFPESMAEIVTDFTPYAEI